MKPNSLAPIDTCSSAAAPLAVSGQPAAVSRPAESRPDGPSGSACRPSDVCLPVYIVQRDSRINELEASLRGEIDYHRRVKPDLEDARQKIAYCEATVSHLRG